MAEYVAAIDIGTTKVVTLVAKKTENGRYHILAHSEAPAKGVRRGQVENITEVVDALKPTIEEVRKKSGINFTEVFVGIAGQHIRCTVNHGDLQRENYNVEITEQEVIDLEKSMYNTRMEPGEQILHVIPQDYSVDAMSDVQNPVGRLGQHLSANYHIIVGKEQSTQHTELCIDRVGLKLNRMILEPLASARSVLTDDEKELGVAMIDMGGGTTDLLIYSDNVVRHTAVIPFGGNIISEDIRRGCSVLLRQAEQMKIQYGFCLSTSAQANRIVTIPGVSGREPREISFRMLASIIEARLEEIIGSVMYEIGLSGYANKLPAGIVFTGGGALFPDMPQFIRYKTGYEVRIAKPQYLTPDCAPGIFREAYATGVGLIMMGFDYMEQLEKQNPKINAGKTVGSAQNETDGGTDTSTEETSSGGMSFFDKFKDSVTKFFKEGENEV